MFVTWKRRHDRLMAHAFDSLDKAIAVAKHAAEKVPVLQPENQLLELHVELLQAELRVTELKLTLAESRLELRDRCPVLSLVRTTCFARRPPVILPVLKLRRKVLI